MLLRVEEVSPLVTKWFGDHRESPDVKARVLELPDADAGSFESGNVLLMPLSGSDTKIVAIRGTAADACFLSFTARLDT